MHCASLVCDTLPGHLCHQHQNVSLSSGKCRTLKDICAALGCGPTEHFHLNKLQSLFPLQYRGESKEKNHIPRMFKIFFTYLPFSFFDGEWQFISALPGLLSSSSSCFSPACYVTLHRTTLRFCPVVGWGDEMNKVDVAKVTLCGLSRCENLRQQDEQGNIWVESRQLNEGGNTWIIEPNRTLVFYCGWLLINAVVTMTAGDLQHFISISNVYWVTLNKLVNT